MNINLDNLNISEDGIFDDNEKSVVYPLNDLNNLAISYFTSSSVLFSYYISLYLYKL